MNKKLILTLVASTFSASANAEGVNLNLSPVVVTATRVEQNSFDLPMSINSISGDLIRDAQQQVHLSETAARIPGIVVNSRNHGSQELSISSRGFGARSQFGIRGIRLYVDGIPLTMPDGQGQSGTFNLDNASSIEFLRGPFSALYGNSSGGVVQLFTKKGGPETELSFGAFYGDFRTHRETATASGQVGNFDYVLNAAHYETDGYRDFSAYKRDTLNAKLGLNISDSTRLTLIATDLDQPYVQDPGGLKLSEFNSNPRLANANNKLNKAHKEIKHTHVGLILDHMISESDSIKSTVYYGTRDNYQSLSTNDISGYSRDFGGLDAKWTHKGNFFDMPMNFTVGLNYDSMRDDRYRYTGGSMGQIVPTSVLNRKEVNRAYNFDQYAQMQWDLHEKISLHGGVRRTKVTFENTDLIGHTYDSQQTYSETLPVLGVTYKVTPTVNLYANAGKGFETPTFVEQAYDTVPTPTGRNANLKPSKSKNYEVGAKAFLGDNVLMNLALFKVLTENEIVVDQSSGGISSYKNAGDTERSGLELSLDGSFAHNIKGYVSYTYLDAEFSDSFGSVSSGNKIPGAYKERAYTELSWKHPETGFFTALEGIYSSKTFVNDTNTAEAGSYTVFNWRGGFNQKLNKWKFTEYMRWENLTDKNYVSSIRPNDNQYSRYYEPGLPSNLTVGVNVSYQF